MATEDTTPVPERENAAPQSTEQLTMKERILRLHSYLKEKENWEKEVLSEIQEGPQTPKYETYKGPRGDDVKKAVERIRKDLLTEKEEAGVEVKKKVRQRYAPCSVYPPSSCPPSDLGTFIHRIPYSCFFSSRVTTHSGLDTSKTRSCTTNKQSSTVTHTTPSVGPTCLPPC